jgi:hypothetical protein
MSISKRKQKIKELETELRLINNIFYVKYQKGSGHHNRYNKYLLRNYEIIRELEEISLKWKIKKVFRRLKEL